MKLDNNIIIAAVSRAMRELSDEAGYAERVAKLDISAIREMAELHGILGQLSDISEALLSTNKEYARMSHICVMAIAGLVMLEKIAPSSEKRN